MKRFIAFLLITFYTCTILFSQVSTTLKITAEPYTKGEFPDWAHQLRRTEIITLGSLPFTTLGVTTAYSIFRYAKNDFDSQYIPNPLAKSSSAANLDEDEQKNILFAALTASLIVGIIDLVITLIKKDRARKNTVANSVPDGIIVQTESLIEETEE